MSEPDETDREPEPGPATVTAGSWGFELPRHWEMPTEVRQPLIAVARETGDDLPFRASVVLAEDSIESGTGLLAWQASVEEGLPDHLGDYRAIDIEQTTVDGRDALRRLGTYSSRDNLSLTIEQWGLIAEKHGLSLTATSATPLYAAYAPLFRSIVGSLRYEGER